MSIQKHKHPYRAIEIVGIIDFRNIVCSMNSLLDSYYNVLLLVVTNENKEYYTELM